jgi:hypothetical protein
MSLDIFPAIVRGLGFTVSKGWEFPAIVQTSPSGDRTAIGQADNPIWHWELKYDLLWDDPSRIQQALTATDLQTMVGFLMKQKGPVGEFLYEDPDDNAAVTQRLSLVNDGAGNYYSPIQRDMGGLFLEDITDLQPLGEIDYTTLTVKANSVTQNHPANYSLIGPRVSFPGYSFLGLVIQWAAQPTEPITASFEFYHRVCIESSKHQLEKFVRFMWSMGGEDGGEALKLMTARVPSV